MHNNSENEFFHISTFIYLFKCYLIVYRFKIPTFISTFIIREFRIMNVLIKSNDNDGYLKEQQKKIKIVFVSSR